MEMKVPSMVLTKFNEKVFQSGTPVVQKYDVNEHWFNALVHDYGPRILYLTNGHWNRAIEVEEVLNGTCQVKPLFETSEPFTKACVVFDHNNIPPGSIFIDQDGLAFMIIESDPFYLTIKDHEGNASDIQAEIFFSLDDQETSDIRIHLPESWVIERAEAYKEANMTDDELAKETDKDE